MQHLLAMKRADQQTARNSRPQALPARRGRRQQAPAPQNIFAVQQMNPAHRAVSFTNAMQVSQMRNVLANPGAAGNTAQRLQEQFRRIGFDRAARDNSNRMVANRTREATLLIRRVANQEIHHRYDQVPAFDGVGMDEVYAGRDVIPDRSIMRKLNTPGEKVTAIDGMRYFRVHVPIREGDDSETFMINLQRSIKDINSAARPGNYEDIEDDDMDLFDIISAEASGFDPMKFAGRVAFHQFSKLGRFESIALSPIRLRDFNCVYESLCVIYHIVKFGSEPHPEMSSWSRFVHLMFLSETLEFHQIICNGAIEEIIYHFNTKYHTNVQFFHCHMCLHELAKIEECEKLGMVVAEYYIAYYGCHAFPVHRSKLVELMEIVRTANIKKGPKQGVKKDENGEVIPEIIPEQQQCAFSLIPRLYRYFDLEIQMVVVGLLRLDETWCFRAGVRVLHVVAVAAARRTSGDFEMKTQKSHREFYKTLMNFGFVASDEDMITEMKEIFSFREEADQQKERDRIRIAFEKETKITTPFYIGPDDHPDDVATDECRYKIGSHRIQWEQTGVAAIDIETCIDNTMEESMYNMRPFMLHLHGRLRRRRIEEYRDKKTGMVKYNRVVSDLERVDSSFIGLDCCEQFVKYMLSEGFAWSDAEYTELMDQQWGQRDSDAKIYNYIFAHNGFGFDFLYLFEPMIKTMSGFKLIGDSSKAKSYQGNGIFEYDFMLIYREPLAKLAKTFFPDRPELWKGECKAIIDMPIQEVRDLLRSETGVIPTERPGLGGEVSLKEIVKYCRQDTVALYCIVDEFFRKLYCDPMGMGFVSKMVYHSLSAVAWDVLHSCFLKVPLFVNPHTQEDEQRMKIGGCTVDYRHRCGFGMMIDVTSEYPSAMMNLMPVFYKRGLTPEAIEKWAGPHMITGKDLEDGTVTIVPYNMYYIRFRFPDDCVLPTISMRTDSTLIQPLMHEQFDQEGMDGDWLPIWGDSIITALKCVPAAKIRIAKWVQFQGEYVFKEFIEYMFKNRLRAQKRVPKDELGDKFYKNMMNMAFGKFGQRNYAQAFVGTKAECSDKILEIQQFNDVLDWKIKQLPTEKVPMYELKIMFTWERLMNKGSLVRMSSYIMEVSRNHLMTMKHVLAKEFGADCICYSDTDSIAVSFDKIDPSQCNVVEQLYDDLINAVKDKREDDAAYARKGLDKVLVNNKYIKRVSELEVRDLTKIHTGLNRPLIHASDLGACKIEKYFSAGAFLAPKQYTLWAYYENGTASQMIKVKGIQQKYMTPELFQRMISTPVREVEVIDSHTGEVSMVASDDGTGVTMPMAVVEVQQWRRKFTGCHITKMVKMITFAHKKRKHNLDTLTSRPFRTISDQVQNARRIEYHMKRVKEHEKGTNVQIKEVFEKIRAGESYRMVQAADCFTARLQVQAMDVEAELRDTLDESRKRFMIKLPKQRWDSIHDPIMRELSMNEKWLSEAGEYLPKMISIIHKAVYVKKTIGKRAAGNGLEYDISARVIAYCLFCQYVIQQTPTIRSSRNFDHVCERMRIVVRAYLDDGLDVVDRGEDSRRRGRMGESREISESWQKAVDWGLRFLSAPVAILNYQELKEQQALLLVNDYSALVPLNKSLEVTTLWRFLTNLMNHLDKVIEIAGSPCSDGNQEEKKAGEEIGEDFEDLIEQFQRAETSIPIMRETGQGFDFVSELNMTELMISQYANKRSAPVAATTTRNSQEEEKEDIQYIDTTSKPIKQVVSHRQWKDGDTVQELLGKRRDHPRKTVEEGAAPIGEFGLNEFAMEQVVYDGNKYPQLVDNVRGKEQDKKVQHTVDQNHWLLFRIFMASPHFAVEERSERRQTMVDNILSADSFPIAEDKLYLIFMDKADSLKNLSKDQIIDFCLVFQFLYFGEITARDIMRKVMRDWSRLAAVSDTIKVFITAARIVFQRPDMFPMLGNKSSALPKFIRAFFKYLTDLVNGEGASKENLDQQGFRDYLIRMTRNLDICRKVFGDTLLASVTTNELAVKTGRAMVERLLKWAEPSPEMIVKLKAILLAQSPQLMASAKQQEAITKSYMETEIFNSEEWGQLVQDRFLERLREENGGGGIFTPVELDHEALALREQEHDEFKEQIRREAIAEREAVLAECGKSAKVPLPTFKFDRRVVQASRAEHRAQLRAAMGHTPATTEIDAADILMGSPAGGEDDYLFNFDKDEEEGSILNNVFKQALPPLMPDRTPQVYYLDQFRQRRDKMQIEGDDAADFIMIDEQQEDVIGAAWAQADAAEAEMIDPYLAYAGKQRLFADEDEALMEARAAAEDRRAALRQKKMKRFMEIEAEENDDDEEDNHSLF